MIQIRQNKQKPLVSHIVAGPFVCACFAAGMIMTAYTAMTLRKEAAP